MAQHVETGIVQSFERVTKEDGTELVEVIVDIGQPSPLKLEHFADIGVDAPPLPGDLVALAESTGQGALRTAGYADPKNQGSALGGERRTIARDADGVPTAEIWSKANGDVSITSIKSGGKIILNGVEIDQQGNVTVPGKVDATGEVATSAAGAPVKLSTHLHPTGVGPSGAPTPGT